MTLSSAAAVFQRKATAIVNAARVIATVQYHFVIAVWRAKEAYSKYDHRPVALRIELVQKVDDHLYPRVILLTVSLRTAICLFPYH